jgi:hypothetical protein
MKRYLWSVALLGLCLAAYGQSAGFAVDLNKAGDGAIIVKYTGKTANLVIPRELEGFPVKAIGPQAFAGNNDIRDVVIPDTVESIGDYAFLSKGITSITIPASVKEFGKHIFGYPQMRTGSAKGVTTNSTVASNLAKVTFTGNRTSIPADFFAGLSKRDEQYGEENTTSLATVVLPPGLTSIPDSFFEQIPSLKTITIPDSVTEIGNMAFFACEGLTSVTLPKGLTSINGAVFGYCTSLKSITIPASVKTIWIWAFRGSGLESITLPAGLEEIGAGAFANCTGLKNITIPASITSLQFTKATNNGQAIEPAFSGCTALPLAIKAKLRSLGYTEEQQPIQQSSGGK